MTEADEKRRDACVDHLKRTHQIDLRLTTIEERTADIKDLKDAVVKVGEHISRQNGSLPRMEGMMRRVEEKLGDRLHQLEDRSHHQEVQTSKLAQRQAIIWGLLSAVGTGVLGLVIWTLKTWLSAKT